MSYNSQKGWAGQQEVMQFLTRTLPHFRFFNVNGSEKTKKTLAGDVCLDQHSDPSGLCVLRDYFIEVKKQAAPNIWADTRKARDDAQWWNKFGYILFTTKQARGELGLNKDRLVVMDWVTFARIMAELQGFRFDAFNKTVKE